MFSRHTMIRITNGDGTLAWEAEIDRTDSAHLIPGCVEVKGPTHNPYWLLIENGKRVNRVPRAAALGASCAS